MSPLFLAVILTIFASGLAAPAVSPPGVDCTTLVLNLADCLSYVSAGSEVDKPEGTCCAGLKSVLKSHADCLCDAFKNSAQFGVTLNVTKALALPAACHVSSPSISNCGLSLVSAGAPASAPVSAMSPITESGSPMSASGTTEAAASEPAPASSGFRLACSTGLLAISTLVLSFLF